MDSDETESVEPVRLQKLLGNAGVASRRVVEEMIEQERITVNGKIATLGDRASASDEVLIDGAKVSLHAETETYLLHKPLDVLSSSSDDRGRTCVVDLIESDARLFPVGRLDINTSGLIIITNDGDLTYQLTHPKFGVMKKYAATFDGDVRDEDIERLKHGVELEDGMTAPAEVRILARTENQTLIEISIHEGRNRQIRRMGEAIGHEVLTLHRSAIGPISDNSLMPGQYRELNRAEILSLIKSVNSENVS